VKKEVMKEEIKEVKKVEEVKKDVKKDDTVKDPKKDSKRNGAPTTGAPTTKAITKATTTSSSSKDDAPGTPVKSGSVQDDSGRTISSSAPGCFPSIHDQLSSVGLYKLSRPVKPRVPVNKMVSLTFGPNKPMPQGWWPKGVAYEGEPFENYKSWRAGEVGQWFAKQVKANRTYYESKGGRDAREKEKKIEKAIVGDNGLESLLNSQKKAREDKVEAQTRKVVLTKEQRQNPKNFNFGIEGAPLENYIYPSKDMLVASFGEKIVEAGKNNPNPNTNPNPNPN